MVAWLCSKLRVLQRLILFAGRWWWLMHITIDVIVTDWQRIWGWNPPWLWFSIEAWGLFAGDLIQVIISPINSRDICLHIPPYIVAHLIIVLVCMRATSIVWSIYAQSSLFLHHSPQSNGDNDRENLAHSSPSSCAGIVEGNTWCVWWWLSVVCEWNSC